MKKTLSRVRIALFCLSFFAAPVIAEESSPADEQPPAETKECTKTKCSEMASCNEAEWHLKNCGLSRLDRDKDGIPCEALCKK